MDVIGDNVLSTSRTASLIVTLQSFGKRNKNTTVLLKKRNFRNV